MLRSSGMTRYLIAAIFWTCIGSTGLAESSIEQPLENEEYATTSSIGCQGYGDEMTSYVLKLKRGSTTEDSETVDTGQGGTWEHTFEPPTSGWPVGDYTVELWYLDTKVDSVAIKIVQSGPAG